MLKMYSKFCVVLVLEQFFPLVNSLTYHYGNGSYYVGRVDNSGRPTGQGKFFNMSGALGKRWKSLTCMTVYFSSFQNMRVNSKEAFRMEMVHGIAKTE